MRKIINMVISISLLAFISSCYDLDRYPNNQLSAGTFWKTEDQAHEAMSGMYSMLQNDNITGIQFGLDCLGSIGSGYDAAAYSDIGRGTYTSSSSWVTSKWSNLYEGISRANLILQNIDKVDMSDQLKDQYKAEARFMRAFFYFELLKFYGGVPIYDESVVVSQSFNEMKSPRNSAEDVRAFIIKDLDAAISGLPEEWPSSDYGRATKWAAVALEGKVYLYNKQYSEAANCFQQVVSSGKYALYNSYEDLFKPGGDESNEMIFAIQNMGGVGQDYGMPMTFYMGTRSSYGSCWDNVTVATDFVDNYECIDGKPFNWDEWIPGFNESDDVKKATFMATLSPDLKSVAQYPKYKETLLNMYKHRDPRMSATLILPYTMYKGWAANAPSDDEYVIASGVNENNHFIRVNNGWHVYLFRKFVAEYNMDGAINNRADTPINFPLIRYADVLLMLAECDNELGKLDEAVKLINQVRARVGMPGLNSGPEWLKATSKDEVFKRIKHERAVEFAGEGLSFDDYKRWGLLQTLSRPIKAFTGETLYNRIVRDRDYLWPIPQTEIDQNNSLEQNPGW